MIGPPIGVEPAKIVVYTLITRPRSPSGTASCIVVFAEADIVIAPNPSATMINSETAIVLEAASATSDSPRTTAPSAIRRGRAPLPNASHSAASSDPTPDAAIRNPYVEASPWRTSWAYGGMITLKLMATVDTSPMTITAMNTSGVRRT